MRRLSRRPAGRLGVVALGLLGLVATGVLSGLEAPARADERCPWIVRPHQPGIAPEPTYAIWFDGAGGGMRAFYGFSVTTVELAWRLAGADRLPDLGGDALPLDSARTADGVSVFRVAPGSLEPNVIYLTAAPAPVDPLERLGARIEPELPLVTSQLAAPTRGGSDQSGPLPGRSVRGFLIAEPAGETATLRICAFQVTGG